MKILYAIQNTGNGHLARAREILPHLTEHAELDILVSGKNSDIQLNHPVKYNLDGISFSNGQNGRVDFLRTVSNLRCLQFIKAINELPCDEYDLIISDFEPISAWASKKSKTPCLALSHQAAFLSENSPRPGKGNQITDYYTKIIGEMIFRHYAPSDSAIGFHFESYDKFIKTPVIRSEIRDIIPSNHGHITVYLPAYGDELLVELLRLIPERQFQVFNRHTEVAYEIENIVVQPVSEQSFLESMGSCDGLITGAGFQSSSEAIFLGKKLFVIPTAGQYEQLCNVAALNKLGVPHLRIFNQAGIHKVRDWALSGTAAKINFPDRCKEIAEEIIRNISKS